MMNLEHLGDGRELVGDTRLTRAIGRAYRDEREETLVKRPRVDLGNVARNDALRLEFAEPFEHGGGRESYGSGDFDLRKTGILLQQPGDFEIDGIEHGEVLSS